MMADDPHELEPTQQTQPKKGEPNEIPVPTREQVLQGLKKLAKPAAKPSGVVRGPKK